MNQSTRIIGGKFGLEQVSNNLQAQAGKFAWQEAENRLALNSARSALWLLARELRLKRVWLPSYLCPTMLEPFIALEIEPLFFPVGKNLKLLHTDWLNDLVENDLVIYIDYFGFSFSSFPHDAVAKNNCFILCDSSQALFSVGNKYPTDFEVYSPRKYLGVADGGIITWKKPGLFTNTKLIDPSDTWAQVSIEACQQRTEFDCFLRNDKEWRKLFNEAEDSMPVGAYSMSELSNDVLENRLDISAICGKRRENYLTLLNGLQDLALFKSLPDDVIPLGFPICVEHRDKLQQELFSADIYPPVHWKIDHVVPSGFSESLELSEKILTLPCDQRYSLADMNKVIKQVRLAHSFFPAEQNREL